MPTANEVGRLLEQKHDELANWLRPRQTENGLDFRGDDLKAFQDRNTELSRLNQQYKALTDAETAAHSQLELASSLRQVDRRGLFGSGSYGATQTGHDGASNWNGSPWRGATKSIGQLFIESPEYKNFGASEKYSVDLPAASIKTITTTDVLPYPAQQPGFVPYPSRRPTVADLIPQTDTDQPSIVYLEETTETFGADTVAEGATKPESSFSWTRRTSPFEVIAHWTKISNQSLEDVPAIRDILNQRMTLGLQLAEEDQLLSGTGTAPDLEGFLVKSSVQSQAKGSDDIFTAFMKALTKVRVTGRATPTGAVFHPNDWQDVLTYQDSTGRFVFGDPAAIIQTQTLWGVRVVVTDAIPENTALVGDFQMYSRLWRKGGVRVIVDRESDDLKKNLQTILVEERVALEISRGPAFCKLTGI